MMEMDAAQDQLPPPRRDRAPMETCCLIWCLFWCVIAPIVVLALTISFILEQALFQDPHYSAAIRSVSGLDRGLGGGPDHPTLDLEFNLTLRVASHRVWADECAGPGGMRVEVSYRGALLASTMTPTEQICAGPKEAADWSAVARGSGVVMPSSVLYALTADMRSGVQVFDVALRGTGNHAAYYTCGPRRVDDACALQVECDRGRFASTRTTGHYRS